MDDYGYSAGIARNASESEYPDLWRNLVGLFVPSAQPGWRLMDLSGGETSYAMSGTKRTSTNRGKTLSFTAPNYVHLPLSLRNKISVNNFTVMLWFRPTATMPAICGLISCNNGFYGFPFSIRMATGLAFAINTGGDLDSGFVPTVGKWAHVAVTLSNAGKKIYINGTLRATNAYNTPPITAPIPANQPLGLGYDYYSGAGRNFTGDMDDIRVYQRTLSASEIMRSYMGASPLVPLNRPYFNSPTTPPPAGNTTNFFRFFR
jgi:hypothetical protein